MSNQQKLFHNLEQMAVIEKQIDGLGITSASKVKELSKKMAKLNRQSMALLAMEVFGNE